MSEKKNSVKKNIFLPHSDDTAVPCKGVCVVADPGATDTDNTTLLVTSVEMDFNSNQGKSILPIDIQFDKSSDDHEISIDQTQGTCYYSTFPYTYPAPISKTVTFYKYLIIYNQGVSQAAVVEGDVTALSVSWTEQKHKIIKTSGPLDSVKITDGE